MSVPLGSVIIPILLICVVVFAAMMLKKGFSAAKIVTVTVAIIIIAAAVPFISGEEEAAPTSQITQIDTMYYDDYLPCESTLTVDSGNIEIVRIGNKTYAHANGLGEATITQDGTQNTISILKAPLDVFMIAGQSNAEHGIYNRVDAEPKGMLGTTYYYGSPSRVIIYSSSYDVNNYGIYDMVGTGAYPIAANIDLPFSATYYKITGHKTLVVNAGVAGSPVLDWIPGGDCYNYAKAIFNDAINKIDTDNYDVTIKSYIWIQGEADSGTSVSTYKTRFLSMHNSLMGEDSENVFSSIPFDGCLISKVRSVNGVNSSKAELQLADSIDSVFLATTEADTFTMANALMLGDNLHYSQLGDNLIGIALGDFAAHMT